MSVGRERDPPRRAPLVEAVVSSSHVPTPNSIDTASALSRSPTDPDTSRALDARGSRDSNISVMAQSMDKLDRSILDTERFIIIEQQVLQGSVAMAAAQRRSSKGGSDSNALIRQAELGIDQSKERLEFLRGQLEKKKRRRMGAPKVEEKKWNNQLDLIRAETPLSVPRISHMLNSIEFKLKLEDQFKHGREKMASALANPKDDKREKAKLLADQQESNHKIKLLKQALKKYNNLLCDEDEQDEDLKNPAKEAVARKPISGRLSLSLKAARDLEHAPLPSSRSSKYFNETTVEFKIHGNVKDVSHPSRTDRWMQDFDIEMDKADEVEIAFYDQQGGQKNPPPRVLIGVMWLKVSDLLEALRRQKVEGMDGEGAGWVTAATVRGQDGSSSSGGGGGRRNGDVDAPLGQHGSMTLGGHGGASSAGHGGPSDGLDGWFNVEPQGAVNFHLDFVKENVRRRPLDAAGGLGRQGAVKKRKGEVHEMNGHKFIKRQFFQIILCALCNNLLRTGDGYQCEDCRYMCHEGCYRKVLTKCISKPNSEMENDEDKINHNIPHRFEPYSNITTNWCSHCGFLLPLGRKIPRKCTECSITCHEECAHLVPNFCGMTMENANALIGMMQAVKKTKTTDPSKRLPASPSASGGNGRPPPPHSHSHSHSHSSSGEHRISPPAHQQSYQQQQQLPPQPPSQSLSMDGLSLDGQRRPQPQPPAGYNADRERDYQNRLSQQSYGPPSTSQLPPPGQQPPRGDRPLPQTPGANRPPPPPSPYDQPPPPSQYAPVAPSRSEQDPYGRPQPPPQHPQAVQQQQQQQQIPRPSPPPQHPQAVVPVAPLATNRLSRRSKIGLEDFNFLTVLGKGNFGKVMLAEEKKSNALYAIKVLKKEFIIENDEVDSTKSEKRVFLAAAERKHPFLLNLHSCFQTETRIYFVMEYVSGGDLMLHIQRKQFTFRQAKFYAAEVLLALEYFHQKGIIYRDLKLDNILLTVEGHIKVADYGLCKEDMWYGKTTSTFCGTPEFMAPEILMEQRYGRAVDWWAFGVLTYEMLLGQSPFRGDDEDEIFDAILEDPPLYPITMPPKAVMLLQGLLERDPAKRLGSGESDALEIKKHPFFADVDFDAVYNKQIPPTYFPNVKNAMDTTNFDSEFTNEQPTLTPVHGRLGAKDQEEFHGFSWIAPWASNA